MAEAGNGEHFVFLLIGTFRNIIDELHAHQVQNGFANVRPIHGFALQAIGADAISITELGRRLGVTKQAAAKTVKQLAAAGFITSEADPADARVTLIRRSPHGEELIRSSGRYFAMRQAEWEQQIGKERFAQLVQDLSVIGGSGVTQDFVGWLQSKPAGE